jgi:hypothetical protein
MIARYEFGPPRRAGARTVRELHPADRSTLPLSAACLVANGVREQLTRLLGVEHDVELVEPSIPRHEVRRTLFGGALAMRVRGRLGDVFLIVRASDARRLVGVAFAEGARSPDEPLSDIELRTMHRIMEALLPLCAPLCGNVLRAQHDLPERVVHECVGYFEVRTVAASPFAIGFALTFDPPGDVGPRVALGDIRALSVPVAARVDAGELTLAAVSTLAIGDVVPLQDGFDARATLCVGNIPFARGCCGIRSGRLAFELDRVAS